MLQRIGLAGVVVVDVLTFCVSGLLVMFVNSVLEDRPRDPAEGVERSNQRPWRDWILGLQSVRRENWVSLLRDMKSAERMTRIVQKATEPVNGL
jgi:hypothetical protein